MRGETRSLTPPRSHRAMTLILGLDLGEFKSVSCLYRPAAQEARYDAIDTDPTILRRHLEHLRPDLVAFETGTVAGWVADLCDALGIARLVADPRNDARRRSEVKRKADRDDAPKLARMAALGEL